MSGCLACTDPPAACKCPAGTSCYQTSRSCNSCPKNVCASSSGPGNGGGANLGSTIGGAVGGVVGIIAALGLIYFFWWKPRGLEASRKRYSRHLSNRQSKLPPPNSRRQSEDVVAKRTSVHLRMDGTPNLNEAGARRRTTSPGPAVSFALNGDRIGADSTRANGGHSRTSLESENPFADHSRSSIGTMEDLDDRGSTRTSDFSFRSSQSTNIIPIAYIPPHSNSMSVDDANRGPYGEVISDDAIRNSLRPTQTRASVPVSMASRDSLSFAGSDLIDLHPLPPVLHADKLTVPGQSSAPIRPPRSPGLDLKLPATAPTGNGPTLTSPHASQLGMRPTSLLPSIKSTSSGLATPTSPRGLSVLLERSSAGGGGGQPGSHLSTISNMSASTSRSGSSTMSYILDPPQIITPVNSQGLRRIEVLGRGQAGLVKMSGSAAGTSPSVSARADGDSQSVASPSTPSTFGGQQKAAREAQSQDPFSDEARASPSSTSSPAVNIGRFSNASMTSQPLPPMIRHTREESNSTITEASEAANGGESSPRWTGNSIGLGLNEPGYRGTAHSIQFDPEPPSPGFNRSLNPPLSVASSGGLGIPSSARNSTFSDMDGSTGSRSRPLTGTSQWRSSAAMSYDSRPESSGSFADSFVSASSRRSTETDAGSMLDGIPFMGPASTDSTRSTSSPSLSGGSAPSTPSVTAPRSPLFPMPPQRMVSSPPSPKSRSSENFHKPDERSPDLDADPATPSATGPSPLSKTINASDVSDCESEIVPQRAQPDSPLGKPNPPFVAGQNYRSLSRASTNSSSELETTLEPKDRVQSQAISVRSGFASGLSQIPFTLDGGLRDSMLQSERGSMISLAAPEPSSRRATLQSTNGDKTREEGDIFSDEAAATGRPESYASSIGDSSVGGDEDEQDGDETVVVMQAEMRPVALARSGSTNQKLATSTPAKAVDDSEDPFGEHAEEQADARASMDSLIMSAALSRTFEDMQD